jgi:hypothetical protein
MTERKAWQPALDTEPEINPFANRSQGERSVEEVRSPDEDSGPLQGSKDRSDEDALVDVAAGSDTPAKKPAAP